MADVIERQVAIDVLDDGAEFLRRALDDADIVGVERAKYEWGLKLIEEYISDMKELPSAQPDTVKDLVTIFQNSKDMKLIARDGDLRADRIVLGRMPFEWIPVSERLPDVDVPVIVTDYAGGMKEIEVDRCGQYDDSDERFWWSSQNPIAWMPLPESYKGETR